jgi:predicted enzyme related to lactoylglutathione lyase
MNKMIPVVHFEMPYDDAARLAKFYESAFGWKMQKLGGDMGNYVFAQTTETDENQMVKTPGNINGGFAPRSADYSAPSVVISLPDIEAGIKKVKDAGGKVQGEPIMIPGIGRYVWFTDTEGNRVSMIKPISSM